MDRHELREESPFTTAKCMIEFRDAYACETKYKHETI